MRIVAFTYGCVCVCVCRYVCLCMYVCMYVCIYVYIWMYACISICTCMHTCACTCACVCVCVSVRVWVVVCVYCSLYVVSDPADWIFMQWTAVILWRMCVTQLTPRICWFVWTSQLPGQCHKPNPKGDSNHSWTYILIYSCINQPMFAVITVLWRLFFDHTYGVLRFNN